MAKTSKTGKWVVRILLGILGLVLLVVIAGVIAHESRPEGVSGPEADALAQKMLSAIDHSAWDSTGAISWTFAGMNEHLWDRKRHLARVKWADMYDVFVDINAKKGVAFVNGSRLDPGIETDKLVDAAWKHWVNDAFWLNAPNKAFDPGTSRSIVTTKEGEKALLVSYSSGGNTPGDAYMWILDDQGLPVKWKMWVSIIPVGGVGFSWDGWQTLPTGARISGKHEGVFTLVLGNVKGAATLEELIPGPDPFKVLFDPPL